MAFLTSSSSWLERDYSKESGAIRQQFCLCSCSVLLATSFTLRVISTSLFQNKPELSTL